MTRPCYRGTRGRARRCGRRSLRSRSGSRGCRPGGGCPQGASSTSAAGTSFTLLRRAASRCSRSRPVLRPPEADLLVLVSHEGATQLTLEAARAFSGPKWLVTGKAGRAARRALRGGRRLHARDRAELCHTASYTCAVAALAALRGDDISKLPDRVADVLAGAASPGLRRTSASWSPAPGATGRPRRRRR